MTALDCLKSIYTRVGCNAIRGIEWTSEYIRERLYYHCPKGRGLHCLDGDITDVPHVVLAGKCLPRV